MEGLFSGGWIRCGHPECGLQIVYDPKEKQLKSTGETKKYEFYRCSNSKKVHQKLKYISQELIWNQFEELVDQVSLSEALANRISNALNEINERAKAEVKADLKLYQQKLDKLDGKSNMLLDAFTLGDIDRDEFKRQSQRLQEDRRYYTSKLEESQLTISDAWRISAQRVFELAKNVKSLRNQSSVEQRIEIIKTLSSNQRIEELTLRYDLKKPFGIIGEIAKKGDWSA